MELVAHERIEHALEALDALRIYRDRPMIVGQVKLAVERRGVPLLSSRFLERFG